MLSCYSSTLKGGKCHHGLWIDISLILEITLMTILQKSYSANALT